VPFFRDLAELERGNPYLKVTYVIENSPLERLAGKQVMTGRLNDETMDKLGLDTQKQTYFICGPPSYMNAVIDMLDNRGVSSGQIMTEAFSQGAHRQTGKIASWPFNIYAIGGLALLIAAFLILAADLYQTLPSLQVEEDAAQPSAGNSITTSGGSVTDDVNSLEPQVDTNLDQTQTTQTTTPTQTTTVTPTPTTVTPVPSPRTTVS
jgi:hypothetical protein